MTIMSEKIELAPGLTICRALTGLWQVADMERDGRTIDLPQAALAMDAYAQAGFTTFDMADHYGSSELIAGLCRKNSRIPLQLFTKWVPKPGSILPEDAGQAVDKALSRMQSSSIDLMQYHAWNYADPRWLDGLFFLDEERKNGKVKYLGVTNFDTAHLRIAVSSGLPLITNQICYSLLDQRAAGAMTAYCLEHKIHILAFGTLAGGFLSDRWLGMPEPKDEALSTWSQMKYKRFIDAAGGWDAFQSVLRVLRKVADETHSSISNIATRYILDQPAVGGVIIGAQLGKSAHLEDNQRLFKLKLSASQKEMIQEALTYLKPIPGDCGDEYRKPPFLTASGDLSHHIESFPSPFPTRPGLDGKTKALSGTIWEDLAGFSRAIRKGNRILISGTTATHGAIAIGGTDPAAQTHFIIDKIEGALQSLGGKLNEVVRTRIFIRNIADWEAVARAHGDRFKDIQPANTMVRAEMIGDEYLVEMEAEAEIA